MPRSQSRASPFLGVGRLPTAPPLVCEPFTEHRHLRVVAPACPLLLSDRAPVGGSSSQSHPQGPHSQTVARHSVRGGRDCLGLVTEPPTSIVRAIDECLKGAGQRLMLMTRNSLTSTLQLAVSLPLKKECHQLPGNCGPRGQQPDLGGGTAGSSGACPQGSSARATDPFSYFFKICFFFIVVRMQNVPVFPSLFSLYFSGQSVPVLLCVPA